MCPKKRISKGTTPISWSQCGDYVSMYGKLQVLSKLALVEAGEKGVPSWTQAERSLWVVFSAGGEGPGGTRRLTLQVGRSHQVGRSETQDTSGTLRSQAHCSAELPIHLESFLAVWPRCLLTLPPKAAVLTWMRAGHQSGELRVWGKNTERQPVQNGFSFSGNSLK